MLDKMLIKWDKCEVVKDEQKYDKQNHGNEHMLTFSL